MAFTSIVSNSTARARNLLFAPRSEVEGTNMKWMNIYLIGYLIFLAGVTLALWKAGVIDQIGTTWTAIGLVIALGIGIMVSVANSGEKKTIEVDRT